MENDSLKVYAGRLTSERSALKYDYFYLNICPPEQMAQVQTNIGEAITGDKL